MKKTIFALLLSLSCIGMAADDSKTLVVRLSDGSSALFQLSELPRIVFGDEIITVTSSSLNTSFAYGLVDGFYYEGVVDGVGSVRPDADFLRSGDRLCFSALSPRCTVRLYSLNGRMIASCISDEQGSATLSIGELPAGVYVVSFNGKTYKILKR